MTAKKKASAPRPKKGGYDAAAERLKRASQALKVTVPGTDVEPFAVCLSNIPGWVRRQVRKQAEFPIEDLTNGTHRTGLDTYVMLWWISRIIDGELITLVAVEAEWDERCAGIRLGDLETEEITVHDGGDEDADPVGETPGQPD